MTSNLSSIIDFIRYGGSQFNQAGLCYGHSYDNGMDEATQLVLHALHMPHDLNPVYGQARLTTDEIVAVLGLFDRRINERKPAAYLMGHAWFAGLKLLSDERALVPRSPIAELTTQAFEPWANGRAIERVLDLCTGGGSIAIATASHNPDWQVDAVDISKDALSLARENVAYQHLEDRVRLIESDLFANLNGEKYDLIVTNPPYVSNEDTDSLPVEYHFEPELGLRSGNDGLDHVLRILAAAPAHLNENGLFICEVGDSDRRLEALLPDIAFAWIEFKVGQMGVFVLERDQVESALPAVQQALIARGIKP